jgi:D-3-phosphoglycerate dehydrogenase
VDNIDLQAAKSRGVVVVNTPAATTRAVAELTLGLMLALARSIPRGDAGMKKGEWLKKELIGVELSGKTLGVIGMGNIGAEVAWLASALGMAPVGYDPLIPDHEIEKRGARPETLEELYAQADFITLHVPLTAETRGLVDERAFRQMKPGVRLVCTARGGIVDETALLAALQTGQVAGAALDVFDQEPPGASPLLSHPNVIATPHIGAQTMEAQSRAAHDIANEVLAALRGQPLRWRVA